MSTSPIQWEHTACPICETDRADEVDRVPGEGAEQFRLVRCRHCAMIYLNPRPTEASIAAYYPDDYKPYQAPERAARGGWRRRLAGLVRSRELGYPPALTSWYESLLAALAGPFFRPSRHTLTALRYVGSGRLLDVGCGSGWYAQRMRELGWKVTAMDFQAASIARVRDRFGLDVLVGSLPHPGVPPESFDAITLGSVLEHLHHPRRVVAAASQALRPGGWLVLSVPNYDCWSVRLAGRDALALDLPRHLLHFTPATLRKLVEDQGLVVREVDTPIRVNWLRRSVNTMVQSGRWGGQNGGFGRGLAAHLCRVRPIASLVAHLAGWCGQGDTIRIVAERPIQTQQSKAA